MCEPGTRGLLRVPRVRPAGDSELVSALRSAGAAAAERDPLRELLSVPCVGSGEITVFARPPRIGRPPGGDCVFWYDFAGDGRYRVRGRDEIVCAPATSGTFAATLQRMIDDIVRDGVDEDAPFRVLRSVRVGGAAATRRRTWDDEGMSTGTLVLLRHGESEWNALNLFTGWVDVHLTDKGRAEGKRAGELLLEHGLLPDILYTSLLRRAINTANLALDAADRHWIPVKRDWRLNERHYGALQGRNKAQVKDKYGEDQFMLWRRSYDTPPPEIELGTEYSQDGDPRYADLESVPRTECLLDVVTRLIPYWESDIASDLRAGKTVLVAAHGNSLRALVKHLDGISDADIAGLNIPTGIPLRYDLDDDLKPLNPGGTYLDPEAAAAGAAAVANQGAK